MPSCISPPQLRTSYKESNTIKFETKINWELYLIFYQSLNSNKRSFPNSISSPRKPTLLGQDKTFALHIACMHRCLKYVFYDFMWIISCCVWLR
jgi:hypothetical protein